MNVSDNSNAAAEVLWTPRPDQIEPTRLAAYMRWLAAERDLSFDSYEALWAWSVNEIDVFWQSSAPPADLWLPDQGVAPYRGRG